MRRDFERVVGAISILPILLMLRVTNDLWVCLKVARVHTLMASKCEMAYVIACLLKKEMSAIQFPSSEQVKAAEAANELETIKWSELTIGTLYAITAVKTVKGKYGSSAVADLETQDGTQYKAWLPKRLADDIQRRKLPVFVKPKGKKESVKDKSRSYYEYTLIDK